MSDFLEKLFSSDSFYLELAVSEPFGFFADHIYCLKDQGNFSDRNKSVFGSPFSSLKFVYSDSDKDAPALTNISYFYPAPSYSRRNKSFRGWIFGIRFKFLCDDFVEAVPDHLFNGLIEKQRLFIRNPTSAASLSAMFDPLFSSLQTSLEKDSPFSRKVGNKLSERLLSQKREEDTIQTYADTERYSSRSFSRHIRQATGLPPKQIQTLRRSSHAIHQIARPEIPLSVCAQETGYADQSHLTRDFKKRTGRPPGIFRENWRENAGDVSSRAVRFLQDDKLPSPLKLALWLEQEQDNPG